MNKKTSGDSSSIITESIVATQSMCFYCFEVLHHEIKRNSPQAKKHKSNLLTPDPAEFNIPTIECPLFVGWKKQGKKKGSLRLRGCKGTHGTLPLHEGLRQYALLSAFDDSRFSEVREDELPRLSCSVDLLFGFEKIDDPFDWEVGVHGLRIDFVDFVGISRSATFLPSVASQFGFTQKQTVERLIEKSGCNDPLTKKLQKKIKATRFQASVCLTAYEDFINYTQAKQKN